MNTAPLRLALALLLAALPAAPRAAPPAAEAAAEQAALVERLTLDRATSLAAANRRAAEREQALFGRLDTQDKQLRAALAAKGVGETETSRLRAELAQLTRERQHLAAELGRRDSGFAAELAEYRRLIAALAQDPSPTRREALARYAEGDRQGAFPVLEALTEAEENARARAARIKAAAEYRQLATLAAEMRDRGEKPLPEVLRLWTAAASRDGEDFATWLALARLRQEAGHTGPALEAARHALRLAAEAGPRARALAQLGDLQHTTGDSAGARRSFEESLRLREALAKASPDAPAAQRDLSVALEKLADARLAAGDPQGASTGYRQSLAISRRLAAAGQDPEAPRDVRVGLERLGDARLAAGDTAGARDHFAESLELARQLAGAAPHSPRARADLAVALERMGNLHLAAGDAARARELFQESLLLRRRLVAADPEAASHRRALSVSLNRLAAAQSALGQPAARASLEESLAIRRALAEADPASLEARRDVAVSQWRLGAWLHGNGDPGATAHLQASVDAARARADAAPHAVEPREDLAGFLETLGQARQTPAPAASLACLGEAVALRRALARQPGGPAPQQALSRSLTLLALAEQAQGDGPGARRHLEEAVALSRPLAAGADDGAIVQLARQLAFLGHAQLRQADTAAARRSLEEGAAHLHRLVTPPPPAAAQRLIAMGLARLAQQTGQQADLRSAAALLEDLRQQGSLPAEDAPLLAHLHALLAGPGAPGRTP